ncbi:ABC transporter ATP-binding protein [Abyssisolibacter fermentans]|uniref:ABC transporter ATP-binding protein n=1 Tax=Abyssisolibacter fermentans TaxID=1766203 RepID=UPI000AAE71C4|nr:ABC transporter ATP-binding protein [Abyssisolibacter fermentans]
MSFCQNKLEVVGLNKSFENINVVDNISFYIGENEFVALVGPSGCGKSTIFNMISGLLMPDNGKIIIDGKDYTGKTGRVSYMYQKDLLLPWKRIIDNATLPLVVNGMSKKKAREEVIKYFKIFGLEGFENKYPFQLSGGMRQRAALMRTYMSFKDIILLDEPFGRLDAITKRNMQSWLMEVFNDLKASVIFITHDIEEAIFLADRIYILSDRPTKIKEEINVNIKRPRESNIIISHEFNDIKAGILDIL